MENTKFAAKASHNKVIRLRSSRLSRSIGANAPPLALLPLDSGAHLSHQFALYRAARRCPLASLLDSQTKRSMPIMILYRIDNRWRFHLAGYMQKSCEITGFFGSVNSRPPGEVGCCSIRETSVYPLEMRVMVRDCGARQLERTTPRRPLSF